MFACALPGAKGSALWIPALPGEPPGRLKGPRAAPLRIPVPRPANAKGASA